MKKYVNGEYVEMTEEEIAHIEELLKDEPVIEPTIEEQILALQNALITSKISGRGITTITDSSENRMKNLKVFGKSVQEITKSYNLFPIPKIAEVKNEQGSFKRVNTDGSVTIKNVANNSTTPNDWSVLNAKNENVFDDNPELPPGDYSLFLGGTSDSVNKTVQILITSETSGTIIIKTNKDLGWHDFTISKKEKMKILYRPQRINESYEVTIKAMITTRENKGKPFVKYGISEISPENPQEIISVGDKGNIKLEIKGTDSELQEFNIKTPNGLPGIKVDTGGNYTDATGQQWICDEINSTERIQRIGRIDAYDNEPIDTEYMSSTGELSVGANVIYVLKEPIKIPLSKEEKLSIKKLHTNYPTTLISNDENAYMEITYIADTKSYVDTKIAEVSTAIVQKGIEQCTRM